MATDPKNDKLADITAHGLTSSGLPSSSLREVRRAREAEQIDQDDLAPRPMTWPQSRAEQVAQTIKYRQDGNGNRRKGEPD